MKKLSLILALLLVLMAGSAWAIPIDPINDRSPQIAIGTAPGTEKSLQFILDAMFGAGLINAATDQQTAGMWASTGILFPSTVPTVTFEEAGFANINRVGVFSGTDTGSITSIDVFLGPASPGTVATLSWGLTGLLTITGEASKVNAVSDFAGINPFNFGFYLQRTENDPVLFYTVDQLNAGVVAQALAYKRPNSDSWAIAFEDRSGGDYDFNDFVLRVESIQPVPEPATMLLLGSSLIGLAGFGRRKFFKK